MATLPSSVAEVERRKPASAQRPVWPERRSGGVKIGRPGAPVSKERTRRLDQSGVTVDVKRNIALRDVVYR
jgi:hypothetical protein